MSEAPICQQNREHIPYSQGLSPHPLVCSRDPRESPWKTTTVTRLNRIEYSPLLTWGKSCIHISLYGDLSRPQSAHLTPPTLFERGSSWGGGVSIRRLYHDLTLLVTQQTGKLSLILGQGHLVPAYHLYLSYQ